MMLYRLAIALHVLIAITGVGLVGAIPLLARLGGSEASVSRLLRVTQVSFGLVFLTGVAIDYSAAGAFHRTLWFKASFAVLLLVGFAHARARAALRAGASVERWGWVMTIGVAIIAVLMEIKPEP